MIATIDYHNMRLTIDNGILTAADLKSNMSKSWKVKVDPDCGWSIYFQKTQVKTIYSNMQYFVELLAEFKAAKIADLIGFKIDYEFGSYDKLSFDKKWTLDGELKKGAA